MDNMIEMVKKQIEERVRKAVSFDGEIEVSVPKQAGFGDFSVNVAMRLAKELGRVDANRGTHLSEPISAKLRCSSIEGASPLNRRVLSDENRLSKICAPDLHQRALGKNPREIAEEIISKMDFKGSFIDRAEVAGAGFINFYLKDEWLEKAVLQVLSKGCEFGKNDSLLGQKINLEYVSANPTGPMHMGNARGGALGDSLARAMKASGAEVTREFYLNDAGNQIEKLGNSLYARLMGEEVPEDGYKGEDVKELAEKFKKTLDCFEGKLSRNDVILELIEFAISENLADMKRILESYRVEYDVWFKESRMHEDGEIEEIIDKLKATGMTYEENGALWLNVGEDKNEVWLMDGEVRPVHIKEEKGNVLVRENGIPTYFAADIAYHYDKLVTRGFDRAINVWGADHHGHIARMKRAMEILGIAPERLHIITIQLVRLMRGAEVARMSKRTGNAITLEDLLDEIGVDPARFFFNMRLSNTHFDFDLDLAVERSSNNPVFYVQYAHARICSILKEEVRGRRLEVRFLCEVEKELAQKVAEFPQEVEMVARTLEPSRLTRYAMELAACFHKFYGECRVLDEDLDIRNSRLCLAEATRQTLENVLGMLGVSAPEKM